MENTKKKTIFTSTIFLTNIDISIFNHHQRSQSNQEQCSLCCSLSCFCVIFVQFILANQIKSEFYGPYFETRLFLVTMSEQRRET